MDYKYIITTITQDDRATAVLFDDYIKALEVYAAYVDCVRTGSVIKCTIFYQYSDSEALFPFVYRKETEADAVCIDYRDNTCRISLVNNAINESGEIDSEYQRAAQQYLNRYGSNNDKIEIFSLKLRKIVATIKKEG